jgi:prevent-host-death family protein
VNELEVSVGDARDKLTQLLKAVEDGEQVTITRNGRPVADLVPAVPKSKRKFGTMTNLIIDPNWNAPQNDIDAWLQGDV